MKWLVEDHSFSRSIISMIRHSALNSLERLQNGILLYWISSYLNGIQHLILRRILLLEIDHDFSSDFYAFLEWRIMTTCERKSSSVLSIFHRLRLFAMSFSWIRVCIKKNTVKQSCFRNLNTQKIKLWQISLACTRQLKTIVKRQVI